VVIFIDGNDRRAADVRAIGPGIERVIEQLQIGDATSAGIGGARARVSRP